MLNIKIQHFQATILSQFHVAIDPDAKNADAPITWGNFLSAFDDIKSSFYQSM